MRVKIIKNHKNYRAGEIVEVTKNVAFGLMDSGIGILSKDISESETKVGANNGRVTKLRTYKSK